MLRASLAFLILGLVLLVLTTSAVIGISFEIAKVMLSLIFGLAIITFIASLFTRKNTKLN